MTTPLPSDEMLMSYVDGELPAEIARGLEAAMVKDPLLAVRAVEFLKSRRLARSQFSADLDGDVPERLLGACRRPRQRWPVPALAATAAAIAVLGAAGLGHVLPAGASGALGVLESGEASRALDQIATGESAQVRTGAVRALATFRLPGGTVCRHVKVTHREEGASAVMCRQSQEWKMRIALGEAGAAGYRPASASRAIDDFLEEAGAGQPLSRSDETAALGERSEDGK